VYIYVCTYIYICISHAIYIYIFICICIAAAPANAIYLQLLLSIKYNSFVRICRLQIYMYFIHISTLGGLDLACLGGARIFVILRRDQEAV
jgi:hypothetical protein